MTTTIPARWFYTGRNGKQPRLIVMHCTVSPEMGSGAEDVARYFANLPATNKASAHKVCDNDSIVTCVPDESTAFAAAGANNDGLHLELVGQPTQTREEWLDAFSTNELAVAQTVVAEWSTKFGIPLRWLTVAEVADGVTRGMCTHADVSAAFPKVSTGHWDPGPNFPKDVFPAPIARPQLEDSVKYTYVKKPSDPVVYVARHGEPPIHVGDASFGFDDAAALASYQGDQVVEPAPPVGPGVELIEDAKGVKRKVLILNSVESQRWFGLS
jgi:hypothetical protein